MTRWLAITKRGYSRTLSALLCNEFQTAHAKFLINGHQAYTNQQSGSGVENLKDEVNVMQFVYHLLEEYTKVVISSVTRQSGRGTFI